MAQQQNPRKFVLGGKEFENKKSEFAYDHGWYSITDIVGEERSEIYRSRNAQEAYMKWNVYIGRKKERPMRESRREDRDGYRERRGGTEERRSSAEERGGRSESRSRQEQSERSGRNSGPEGRGGRDRGENRSMPQNAEDRPGRGTESRSSEFRKNKSDKNGGKKNFQHKNNRGGKPKKQYKRQESKIKATDWDSME